MGIRVGEYTINTPVEDVLLIIKSELSAKGLSRFDKIKRTGDNVMTNCPFHKGGAERKPSFGISSKGECHCMACGWSTKSFPVFISEVYGYHDNGDWGNLWLHSKLGVAYKSNRSVDIANLDRRAVHSASKVIIPESQLSEYRNYHPYLKTRHFDYDTDKRARDVIELFDVGYDLDNHCITFPIKDLKGDVVFVATRSVTSKFFSLPEAVNKPIYGAYLFTSGRYREAVICESFFNALTCWKWGIPAMALIGTGSYTQIDILSKLPVRHYILGLDPDDAGNRGAERIANKLRSHKIISRYVYTDKSRDINDLDGEILSLKQEIM